MVAKPSYIRPSDLLKDVSEYRIPEPSRIPAVYLNRSFLGRIVNVLTIPVQIWDGNRPQNIMITNPAPVPGGLVTGTGLVTNQVGVIAAGNSQALPIGVANYLGMHLILNITAINAGSTWSFINQVLNPVTLNWVDSQVFIAGVTPAIVATWTAASFYGFVGQFGVGTQFAMRWTLDGGAGPITFSVSYVLKEGLFGSSGGISQVVYIISSMGGQVVSGYPLLEGSEKVFQVSEGTQLWGVARVATPVNVLELL